MGSSAIIIGPVGRVKPITRSPEACLSLQGLLCPVSWRSARRARPLARWGSGLMGHPRGDLTAGYPDAAVWLHESLRRRAMLHGGKGRGPDAGSLGHGPR